MRNRRIRRSIYTPTLTTIRKDLLSSTDNDPSHGTKSTDNVAFQAKEENWILRIGMWNILFQRVEQ
ncbi:hypothetical protein K469DRAFT_721736 [Zopfia rhizophila CBS 207.26]|uniref:Uncharacterized protein n=1 Tax=Zopfia rhizophila CBS 207.26 TaxID=1314779 RepID=A0A6A6EJC2_9PEZI|nr:hypothetical protein K469DRAFT_721736 [Zopfia rhizophila CBS 207.26]